MPAKEEWKPLPGHEGEYEVSSFGRMKSVEKDSIIPWNGDIYLLRPIYVKNIGSKKGPGG